MLLSLSFIRTMTVGSGISPDLLTSNVVPQSENRFPLFGLWTLDRSRAHEFPHIPPVGTFTLP